MRKYLFLVSLFSAFLCFKPVDLFAQKVSSSSSFEAKTLAVVNLKRIVDESKAAKTAEQEVNNLKDKYLKLAEDKEKELKGREEQLKKQKKAMSEKVFMNKVKEFQQKIMAERKEVAKNRKILEASYVKSLEYIKQETLKVIEKIAKEKGIDVVIPTSSLLYYSNEDARDLSDEVLQRLNERLPEVTINVKVGN